MASKFRTELMRRCAGTPYEKSFSHILLLNNLINNSVERSMESITRVYSDYSDRDIEQMRLLESVSGKAELTEAIVTVKRFVLQTVGRISSADEGLLGDNSVFPEYVELYKEGFLAWADVIADCEEFLDQLEKK